jgi:putative addiction module antidote
MTTALVTDTGLVIPPEVLADFGMRAGDQVAVVRTNDGLALKKLDQVVAQQMEVAKRIMEKRRDVLRRLAE